MPAPSDAAPPAGAGSGAGPLIAAIGALVLGGAMWIAVAEFDETLRVHARLEYEQPELTLQAPFAGTLVSLASQGTPAEAGAVLAVLDAGPIRSALAEISAEAWAEAARIARLEAEAAGRRPVFPADLRREAPDLVAAETALWAARTEEEALRQRLAEVEIAQADHALAALIEREAAASEALALVAAERAARAPLVAAGIVAERSLEPLLRSEADRRGDRAALGAEIERARAAGTAARLRAATATEARRAAILADLAAARSARARAEARLPALAALLGSAEVRSPVAGMAAPLRGVATGSVVAQGQPLVRIVPAEGGLLLRARVDPAVAGDLRPGLAARIALPGAGQSGRLTGRVDEIVTAPATDPGQLDAGTLEVTIITDRPLGQDHGLRAGQIAEVAILTGRRRVTDYLLGEMAP
jgi:adhesin transport system membrane fusion protein